MALPRLRTIVKAAIVASIIMNFSNSGYFQVIYDGMHGKNDAKEEAQSLVEEKGEESQNIDLKNESEVAEFASSLAEDANEIGDKYDAEFVRATVVRVVDGDTIVVNIDSEGDYKVRLIGVNTPESVASQEYLDKKGIENCEEGKAASDFTKEVLSGYDCVYLECDQTDTDKYGRELRYVWLEIPEDKYDISEVETKMLNGYLVSQGYAEVATYAPNVEYSDYFECIAEDKESEFAR